MVHVPVADAIEVMCKGRLFCRIWSNASDEALAMVYQAVHGLELLGSSFHALLLT